MSLAKKTLIFYTLICFWNENKEAVKKMKSDKADGVDEGGEVVGDVEQKRENYDKVVKR